MNVHRLWILTISLILSFGGWLAAQTPDEVRLLAALERCREADRKWRESTGIANLPSFELYYVRDGDPRSLGASFSSLETLAHRGVWSEADKTAAKGYLAQFSKSANDLTNNHKLLNGRSRSGNGDKEREFTRGLIENGLIREIGAAVDATGVGEPLTRMAQSGVGSGDPSPSSAGAATEQARLRTDFAREEALLDSPLATLGAKYIEYLQSQKTAYQLGGNIKGVLAVDQEIQNFSGTPTATLSEFDEIKRLQEIYKTQWQLLASAREEASLKLAEKYRDRAEQLSMQLTQADRIEDAKDALAEAGRFGAKKDFTKSPRSVTPSAASTGVPAAPVTARQTDFHGMILSPDWLPERLGVDQKYTEDLRYYAERVIAGAPQGAATTPDVLWGNLKWLMPVDLAIKSFGNVLSVTSSRITNQSYPHHSLTLHGFNARIEDRGYQFNRVFLISDIKGQLVSVQFVAQAPKITAWLPHPVEDRNPVYDLVNVKRNASTGNQVSFQIIEAGSGVKMIKLVLRKPLARMELPPGVGQPQVQAVPLDLKWLEDSHWYLPAPLAARFIEIAEKALQR